MPAAKHSGGCVRLRLEQSMQWERAGEGQAHNRPQLLRPAGQLSRVLLWAGSEMIFPAGPAIVAMTARSGGSGGAVGEQRHLLGHRRPVVALALDGSAAVLASVEEGPEGAIRLWDLGSGACFATLGGERSLAAPPSHPLGWLQRLAATHVASLGCPVRQQLTMLGRSKCTAAMPCTPSFGAGHAGGAVCLDLSPDAGRLLSVGVDAQGKQELVLLDISHCRHVGRLGGRWDGQGPAGLCSCSCMSCAAQAAFAGPSLAPHSHTVAACIPAQPRHTACAGRVAARGSWLGSPPPTTSRRPSLRPGTPPSW